MRWDGLDGVGRVGCDGIRWDAIRKNGIGWNEMKKVLHHGGGENRRAGW